MRRIAIGLLVLALAGMPALAQRGGGGGGSQKEPSPEEMQKKRDAEALERQYKSTLERTSKPDAAPVRTDPWANMRSTETPKR
jgi:hypothetical protein